MASSTICFLLNGHAVIVKALSTTQTLLQWLREHKQLTGTKEGCAEGDCGACTVVIGELDANNTVFFKPLNACILFVPTLHNKAVFTVEYLRSRHDGLLHPVQQAMLDYHASQCGFCTPGFVMSLWNIYLKYETRVEERTIRSALSGNLCRCTGYRPIMAAAQAMWDYPRQTLDTSKIMKALQTMRESAPPDQPFSYICAKGKRFDAPKTIPQWLKQYAQFPQATIIAGATDVALWATKQLHPLPHLIYIANITALKIIEETTTTLNIGASVSLNDAYIALCRHYPALSDIQERFASMPIRHAGTLGGNIANGSPIGDSMPALIALDSTVVLGKWYNEQVVTRELPLEKFYLSYQKKAWKTGEVLLSVRIPLPTSSQCFASYKVSKRYGSDISSVCAAYSLKHHEGKISEVRIAYGGMAATCKRAIHAESALIGQLWTDASIKTAQAALSQDFQPLSDMRASEHYRIKVAQNLLYRFYCAHHLTYPLPEKALNVFLDR